MLPPDQCWPAKNDTRKERHEEAGEHTNSWNTYVCLPLFLPAIATIVCLMRLLDSYR